MNKTEVIKELKKYFDIKELVCPHTLQKFGEKSWQFLNAELLETLLALRKEVFNVPMTINNGSTFTQRGLRCNICQIPKDKTLQNKQYLSPHCLAQAFDCDVKGYTAEEARRKIMANQSMLPYPIRVERAVNWLHFDVYNDGSTTVKYTEFNG